ncbi:lariat debranching enzyme, C-terminal domain-containing protein [Glomus cerebriforme]|uniref:Lariat debranching enzyme, C-terminal domain-containing protein n=1 Tax=Glomus cerebriforme TaxID=658196 RepID=A0A397TKS9_9GLOM|nr:lariat debranching enzyme, C-terminal domain-containing protein [Glomus cerebriforme]
MINCDQTLSISNGKMKVAIEGCCHNQLEEIYKTLEHIENGENIKIDLLLICGDFETIRNTEDFNSMSVPAKYRTLGSFYKYYTGECKVPYPTLFVGGNHEVMSYLWELYYGGWVCENIYFLGYAGVVNFGGLRIGGLSGIYNDRHYDLGHHETLPYNTSTVRSAYHMRKYDAFKLAQIKQPLDIFLSHDWPRKITNFGKLDDLLHIKPYLRQDIESGKLGSAACEELLFKLKPRYWFAAHHHVKFPAIVYHDERTSSIYQSEEMNSKTIKNPDEINIDIDEDLENPDEINIDSTTSQPHISEDERRDQIPCTKFLALDKCLPGREFLQILDFPEANGQLEFSYDEEWLAITKATHEFLNLSFNAVSLPRESVIQSKIDPELRWIRENISQKAVGLVIPHNFQPTAPAYGEQQTFILQKPFKNPQTEAFTRLLNMSNKINPDGQSRPQE